MGVSSRLREDTLDTMLQMRLGIDPITNEYDCCNGIWIGPSKAPIEQWNESSDFDEDSRSPE